MKQKIFFGSLTLMSAAMLAFAATSDPCTEKFNTCVNSCENTFSQCKRHGSDPAVCERNHTACKNNCEKDKAKCQGNQPGAKKPTPKPAPKKSEAKKN